jgi:hypothetical protein
MRPSIAVPSDANLRYFRRLVWFGLVSAFLVMLIGIVGLSLGGGGRRSPLPVLLTGVALLAGSVRWRSTADRLDAQVRQLASYGRRFPVELARTETMTPGFRSGGLHVVVARWRDPSGTERHALSEGFDYDPAPLLDRQRLQILADPFDPGLCLVAPDTLPPREYRRLGREHRVSARPETWRPVLSRSVSPWIPFVLLLLVLGFFAWALR